MKKTLYYVKMLVEIYLADVQVLEVNIYAISSLFLLFPKISLNPLSELATCLTRIDESDVILKIAHYIPPSIIENIRIEPKWVFD